MGGMEADPMFPRFQRFMTKYNRRYATASETVGRFSIFKDNLKLIAKRNAADKFAKHGINMFADIHPNEFKQQYLGLVPLSKKRLAEVPMIRHNNTASLRGAATSINWADKGATTPVKNQGQCGSCWSFSATEQVESQKYLATGVLTLLSEQSLVSCDKVDSGCNGGNPINAWGVFNNWNGDIPNNDYVYTSGNTQTDGTCKYSNGAPPKSAVSESTKPISYSLISSEASDETNMVAQILKSPMSVCVDATIWQTYTGGLITKASNCGTSLDHAVQAVGINTDTFNGESKRYWIVRNSWTANWGEKGYIYVEEGQNNCGITQQAAIVNM